MGNIITSFFSRQQKMSPDQALQILYDALNAQTSASRETDGPSPAGHTPSSATPGMNGRPSFAEWCRRLGLPRRQLERYLRKELGCSGQELVDRIYLSGLQ